MYSIEIFLPIEWIAALAAIAGRLGISFENLLHRAILILIDVETENAANVASDSGV